jgi:hypothetical protein
VDKAKIRAAIHYAEDTLEQLRVWAATGEDSDAVLPEKIGDALHLLAAADEELGLVTERDDLRDARDALGSLYRFVMESRYARNIAVPSGVLSRARQVLEELEASS